MRDDDLSLLQKLVGHALAQQSAGVLPQVEDQALHFALLLQLVQRLRYFVLGRFLEAVDMDVSNTRLDHEMHVHAIARNLIANDVEIDRLVGALAQHGDLDRRAFRSLQQIGHVAGAHVVGGLAVHCDDHVSRTNARPVSRRSGKRRNHDDLIVARSHLHADAVVFTALIFAQGRVCLGVKKVGVRVEHPQHARDRSVVNGLVRIHRFRVILLHHFVHLGEAADAVPNVAVGRRGTSVETLPKQHADTTAGEYYGDNDEGRTTRTTGHYLILLRAGNSRVLCLLHSTLQSSLTFHATQTRFYRVLVWMLGHAQKVLKSRHLSDGAPPPRLA